MFLPTREKLGIGLAYWTHPRAGHAAQGKRGPTLALGIVPAFPWLLSLRSEMLFALQDGLSGCIFIGKWNREGALLQEPEHSL